MSGGMSYLEAGYGIDADLHEEGIHLKSGRDVLQSRVTRVNRSDSLASAVRYFLGSARRNFGSLLRVVTDDRPFGSPLLFALTLIGLFRSSWSKHRITGEAILLTAFSTSLFILLVGQTHDFRHTLLLLALLAVWGAKGVDELAEWATGTVSSVFSGSLDHVRVALRGLLVLVLSGMALQAINTVGEFSQSSNVQPKEAGLWLKRHAPGAKSIMGTGTTVPYYAGGDLQYLPYAGSDLALRYIERKDPDFVVLESVKARPYLENWLKDGIPSRKARLIYTGGTGDDRVVIYEWRHS
jgi:hypothetical protein